MNSLYIVSAFPGMNLYFSEIEVYLRSRNSHEIRTNTLLKFML